MRRSRISVVVLCSVVPLLCGALLGKCGLVESDFVRVSESGFEPVDNAADSNDYPWSMAFFTPEGASEGRLYAGTGNNFIGIQDHLNRTNDVDSLPIRPAEIRRYRPELGGREWERVYDSGDEGVPFEAIGFRSMREYRAQSDGVLYLYAGSCGLDASLYRSATGDPGTWERVFEWGKRGSIRGLEAHGGLLYFSTTVIDVVDDNFGTVEGMIFATDGDTVWPVIEDGFGNPNNLETIALRSFNGWLYAGTRNKHEGFEIWKFAGSGAMNNPVPVVTNGGPDPRNEAAGTALVFQDRLYFGTLIFGGFVNFLEDRRKGADLIRIARDDSWETVIGEDGISGMGPGFDDPRNHYIWSLAEFNGWLYAGTADNSHVIAWAIVNLPQLPGLITGRIPFADAREVPPALANIGGLGADLYRSLDGVHWAPVFTRGLGNHNNFGLRTMNSASGHLYLGFTNPLDGLEIWRTK